MEMSFFHSFTHSLTCRWALFRTTDHVRVDCLSPCVGRLQPTLFVRDFPSEEVAGRCRVAHRLTESRRQDGVDAADVVAGVVVLVFKTG